MTFAAAALVMTMAAIENVAVRIAPDQPAAFTYADEPLVIEFTSPEPITFHAAVSFTGQKPAVTTVDLGPVSINETGRLWQTVPNAPQARGWWAVEFHFTVDTGERRVQTAFCRIDRPGDLPWQRLRYAADPAAPAAVSAGIAANLGAAELELPAAAYPFAEARRYNVAAALGLNASSPSVMESAPSAPRWWLAPAPAFSDARRIAQRETPTALVAAVGDAAAATALFESAPETVPQSWLVVHTSEALAIRHAAERAGHEGLGLQMPLARITTETTDADGNPIPAATHFLTPFLEAWPLSPTRMIVAHDELFNAEIKPNFARVSALARVLPEARFIGPFPAGDAAVHGALFLLGGETEVADWVVVAEATGLETVQIEWPIEWADKLALRDGYNNPQPSPAEQDGMRNIAVGPEGVFIFGVGGRLPLLASHATVVKAAQDILADEALVAALPAPTQEAVNTIAEANADDSVREAYFVLVRSLPELEREGRAGAIAPADAVPATAAVARLARLQAVWAQEKGDEFLEPLSETLARAAEFKSRYLTGAGSSGVTPHGDWLAGEVSRLVAVARGLAEDKRPIEADAVAALAEWRARSLTAGTQ